MLIPSVILPSVVYDERHNKGCYDVCHFDECRSALAVVRYVLNKAFLDFLEENVLANSF
jgi:hypothetical protein